MILLVAAIAERSSFCKAGAAASYVRAASAVPTPANKGKPITLDGGNPGGLKGGGCKSYPWPFAFRRLSSIPTSPDHQTASSLEIAFSHKNVSELSREQKDHKKLYPASETHSR